MEERQGSADDKTEEPTEERRKQFREQGNIANPRELVSSVSLLVFVVFFASFGTTFIGQMTQVLHRAWMYFAVKKVQSGDILAALAYSTAPVLPSLVALSAIAVLAPVVVGLLFTRFNWSWEKIEFKLDKLNPLSGLQRMFGLGVFIELTKPLLKMAVLIAVATSTISHVISRASLLATTESKGIVRVLGHSLLDLLLNLCIASFVLGGVEFGYNWFQLQKQMRMSKQEIKDEIKGQEGDPLVKSQRRKMARDLALRGSLAQIPLATFVVTNPTHYSVAIRYLKGMTAPVVVAKGQDFLALKIRELAKSNDIILVENKALARTLYKLVKIGNEIPPSLYSSVIEVMKYIYQMRGKDYFEQVQARIEEQEKRKPAAGQAAWLRNEARFIEGNGG